MKTIRRIMKNEQVIELVGNPLGIIPPAPAFPPPQRPLELPPLSRDRPPRQLRIRPHLIPLRRVDITPRDCVGAFAAVGVEEDFEGHVAVGRLVVAACAESQSLRHLEDANGLRGVIGERHGDGERARRGQAPRTNGARAREDAPRAEKDPSEGRKTSARNPRQL